MSSPRVGDRVLENGKEGRVVALRPQDMVDVVFSGRDYPIRRPARSLEVMKSNPGKPKTPYFLAYGSGASGDHQSITHDDQVPPFA